VKVDLYLRVVLTVIAVALVYLCAVLTPLPILNAQTAPRPGMDTGPARCVIVGWQTTDQIPVQVVDSITLKTTGETRILGSVQTEQRAGAASRVVVTGWEEGATARAPGELRSLTRGAASALPPGLPVTTVGPK
jgi:hypothetical protein